jgi:hypothetical protein
MPALIRLDPGEYDFMFCLMSQHRDDFNPHGALKKENPSQSCTPQQVLVYYYPYLVP